VRLQQSGVLSLYQPPELDIVTYFPSHSSMTAIDAASTRLFHDAAALPPKEQLHLATYSVTAAALAARGHSLHPDAATARIMRSTVMKPESADAVASIHATLESLLTQPL
jgi:hypothetical protein